MGDPSHIVAGPDLGNIPELCSLKNMVDPDAKKLCKDTCEKAECRFRHGGCFKQDPNWCLSFDSCKNLGHKFLAFGTEHITKKETQVAEIADICSMENFREQFGQDSARNLCHRICDPYQCCFDGNSKRCDQSCDEFSVCADLYILERSFSEVTSACSLHGTIESCQEICQRKLCCFDEYVDSMTCHVDSCGIFEPCSGLVPPH